MDLLGAYSDDDQDAQEKQIEKDQKEQQQAKDSPPTRIVLPPPDFDGTGAADVHDDEGTTGTASILGAKRGHAQVTGAVVAPHARAGSAKVARPGSTQGTSSPSSIQTAAAGRAGVLLPPQLRGRANVSTEDNEKLFSQRTLNAMARKQSGGQPSPQQQPAAKEHTK